jgi:hypothetical protein
MGFEDFGRTKFCLGLQLEHLHTGILVHQSGYVQKVLEMFNMDKAYSARTPMVVRAFEKETNSFMLKEGEEVLGPEYSYLSVIGALMYLANNTRSYIDFAVNYLVRQRGSYNASLERYQEYLTIFSWHHRSWVILLEEPRIWFNQVCRR